MKTLIQDLICTGLNTVPGVSEILLKNRKDLGDWFYEQTSNLQYGKIIGVSSQTGRQYKIVCRRGSTNFAQNEVSKNTIRLYESTLDIFFNKIEYLKRDWIEQLSVSDDIVVVFRDKNGKYQLMGETNGCKVGTQNFTTGNSTGTNETTIQFTNSERYPIREVDIDFMNGGGFDLLSVCDLSWAEFCSLSQNDVCLDYTQ